MQQAWMELGEMLRTLVTWFMDYNMHHIFTSVIFKYMCNNLGQRLTVVPFLVTNFVKHKRLGQKLLRKSKSR